MTTSIPLRKHNKLALNKIHDNKGFVNENGIAIVILRENMYTIVIMNAIVAVYSDWGIGKNGAQPLVIPEDRQRFMEITNGGVVIAGRKTFEDFRRPLPNRKNVILTRNRGIKFSGVVFVHSIDELLSEIADDDPEKVFIAGGESVYRQLLPMCTYVYVTKIEAAPKSDTFFPNLDISPYWSLDHIISSHECKISICHYSDEKTSAEVIQYSYYLYNNITTKRG